MDYPASPTWPLPGWLIWIGYASLAGWFLHPHGQADGSGRTQRITHALLGLLLLGHAPLAFLPILSPDPYFGAREALSLLTWIATFIYWCAAFLSRLHGLQPILLPVAAASFGLSLLLPEGHRTPWLAAPLMQAHFTIAMLAYGFLAVAAGLAVLMRLADRQLHHPRQHLLSRLPPLLTLESLLFSTMGLGFVLLTATLLTGFVFADQLFGRALGFSHKTVFSIGAWLIFGGLLAGRHWRGWRGRMASNWTLAGFAILLLAYIGSRFVLEVILQRGY